MKFYLRKCDKIKLRLFLKTLLKLIVEILNYLKSSLRHF